MLPETSKKKDKRTGIPEKIIRLLELYSIIAENRYPTLNFLAEHFGVTRRTVLRYLEIIRTIDIIGFFQLPSAWDSGIFLYTGTDQTSSWRGRLRDSAFYENIYRYVLGPGKTKPNQGRTLRFSIIRSIRDLYMTKIIKGTGRAGAGVERRKGF